MAGQGIQPSPRRATWVVKPREASEYIYEVCGCCGQVRLEPSHSVIRVSDAQLTEWHQIGEHSREWGIGISLSALLVLVAGFATFFSVAAIVRPTPAVAAFVQMFAEALVVGVVLYFLTTHQMIRYNNRVRAERAEKKAKLLTPMTGLNPDQVAAPDLVGVPRIKAILLPPGIYDELSYENYLDD